MCTLAGLEFRETRNAPAAIAADLAMLGLFFAMRSCENTTAPKPGRTKTVDMVGVIFLDRDHREILQDHPGVALAACVTLLFADQKNRDKNAWRTQKRTNDPRVLCPVRRAASLIDRIRRLVPGFSGSTTINACAHQNNDGLVTLQLASGFLQSQLGCACTTLGGKRVFGFDRTEIGTKSVRSGAAMGLFLANHLTERIMLMGRWLSQAFLVCIRPQVIEWRNDMSRDMIRHDTFTDASEFDMADPEIARVPAPFPWPRQRPHHSIISLGTLRERWESRRTTPCQAEGVSMDLEPNLGVALDFAKLGLGDRQKHVCFRHALKLDCGLATGLHVSDNCRRHCRLILAPCAIAWSAA